MQREVLTMLKAGAFTVVACISLIAVVCYFNNANNTPPNLITPVQQLSFQMGDDKRWREATIDTQDWLTVNLPHQWHSSESSRGKQFQQFAWYRCQIDFLPATEHSTLALYLGKSGAAMEVYINGHLIGKNADIDPDRSSFVSYHTPWVFSIPKDVWHTGHTGTQVISIRQAQPFSNGGFSAKAIGIGDEKELMLYQQNMLNSELIVSWANLILVLHWLLIFLFLIKVERRQPSYFSLILILLACAAIWSADIIAISSTFDSPTNGVIQNFLLAILGFLLPYHLYRIARHPARRPLILLATICVLWVVVFNPDLRLFFNSYSVRLYVIMLLVMCILSICMSLHAYILCLKIGQSHSIYLGVGIMSLIILCIVDTLPFLLGVDNLAFLPTLGSLISLSHIGFFIFINAIGLFFIKTYQLNKERVSELSEKLISTEQAERGRIARELHDGVSQSLNMVKFQLDILDSTGTSNYSNQQLIALSNSLDEALLELRNTTLDMRPFWLAEIDFTQALQQFINSVKTRTKLDINHTSCEIKLSQNAENHLFRLIQELFQNSLKHSNTEQIKLFLSERNFEYEIQFIQSGKNLGLDKEKVNRKGAFFSLRERVHLLQGEIRIKTEDQSLTFQIFIPQTS